MSEIVHPLSKPIQAHGQEITELTLTKPDGNDVINYGLPMFARRDETDGTVSEGMDMRVVAKYIAKCASIPPSSVKQIELCDLVELGGIIVGFFTKQDPATKS